MAVRDVSTASLCDEEEEPPPMTAWSPWVEAITNLLDANNVRLTEDSGAVDCYLVTRCFKDMLGDPFDEKFGKALRELALREPRMLGKVVSSVERVSLQEGLSMHLLPVPGSRKAWLPRKRTCCDSPKGATIVKCPDEAKELTLLEFKDGDNVTLVRTDVFDMTTKDAAGAEQAGEFYLAFVGSVPGRDRADCPVGAVSVEHLDAESPASGRARSTTAVPAAADAEEGAASDRAGTLLSEFFDHIEKTKGEVQAEFEKMDQDQDGFLSEQEVLEGFTNAGLDVSPADAVEIMLELNISMQQDGKVEYKDFFSRIYVEHASRKKSLGSKKSRASKAGGLGTLKGPKAAATAPSGSEKDPAAPDDFSIAIEIDVAASQPEPQPALDSPATKLKKVSVQRAVPAGAFGALVEILTMMMAGAADADADTAAKGPAAEDEDGPDSPTKVMMEEFVHNKVAAALSRECGTRDSLPLRKELAEKLGEYASLAFECDAHKCGKTVLAALEQLSKDPLEAVREASARSLPTFSACQYADVYAAVGSVYARLSRDPELTPRKALMRRTPDLVQGFKEKQPDKIVPVDVLQGFGSLLDMVTKIVERAEDKSGAGAHESLRNLAKVSEDEEHEGMLNLEGEAAGDEAGEDGAEQESTKRWRNLEMDKLVDEALAALIALMDVLGRNRWDKLATAFDKMVKAGLQAIATGVAKQLHVLAATLGPNPNEIYHSDDLSVRLSSASGSHGSRMNSLLLAFHLCVDEARCLTTERLQLSCRLPAVLWAIDAADRKPEWIVMMTGAYDAYVKRRQAAADEPPEDDSYSMSSRSSSWGNYTATSGMSHEMQTVLDDTTKEAEDANKEELSFLLAHHLPAAILLSCQHPATGDMNIEAWAGLQAVHLKLATDPWSFRALRSLACSLSAVAGMVGRPHAAEYIRPILDELMSVDLLEDTFEKKEVAEVTAGVLGGMASLIEKLPAGAFRTRCMWTLANLPEASCVDGAATIDAAALSTRERSVTGISTARLVMQDLPTPRGAAAADGSDLGADDADCAPWGRAPRSAEVQTRQLVACAWICRREPGGAAAGDEAEPTVGHFAAMSRYLLTNAKSACVRQAAAAAAAEMLDVCHGWADCPEGQSAKHTSELLAHAGGGSFHVRLLLPWVCEAAAIRCGEFPKEETQGARAFLEDHGTISALGTLLKDPVRNVKGAAERVRDRMAAIGIAV